ncbi:MAG: T9SS type A sorting domain-containing protein [Paludibacter sp.]|nr:T9SS type A sorting domain-containing protein [Paludibacter sp.]
MRTIQITTLSGSKVLMKKCSGNTTEVINVDRLNPGNYIVVIDTDKGIITTKVIKK